MAKHVALWVGLYMALTAPIGHPLTFLEDLELGFIILHHGAIPLLGRPMGPWRHGAGTMQITARG